MQPHQDPHHAPVPLDANLGWMDRIVARQRRPAPVILPLRTRNAMDELLRHLSPARA